MNKVKILAVAGLTSIAFAAYGDGGDLWDFPNLLAAGSYKTNAGNDPFWGQVHTPGALFCWGEITPSATNGWGKPCFDGTGGWWFGYADAGGTAKDAVSGTDLSVCEAVVIEKYIEPASGTAAGQNTDWIPNVLNYASKAGHYIAKGHGLGEGTDGFDVKFENPAGTLEDPTVSAIGFNWREKGDPPCSDPTAAAKQDYQDIYTEDLSKYDGLCIVYKADKGNADVGVDVELGWNEAAYQYNTWIVRLPAASSWKTLDMKWEDFAPSYESPEDFYALEEYALKKAEALKFAFKNKTQSSASIHFQLKEVGWFGTCSGAATRPDPPNKWWEGNPITLGKMASAYKFSMNGRMLSANFAGSVQVINMQGMVVAKKTLAAGESLNLANLPVGIYMVRSEKLGIVQKIMVK